MKKQRRISAFILVMFLASIAMGEVHQWLSTSDNAAATVKKSCQRKGLTHENGTSTTFYVESNTTTTSQNTILSISCAPVLHELNKPFGITLHSTRMDFIDEIISCPFSLISRLERPPKA